MVRELVCGRPRDGGESVDIESKERRTEGRELFGVLKSNLKARLFFFRPFNATLQKRS